MSRSLDRPQYNKMVAGVCAGLAERFGWDVNTVRILFVVSCVLPGSQLLVYAVLWVLMPKRERPVANRPYYPAAG